MKTVEITRVFKYNGKTLDDIPGMSEKEVLKIYAGQFPELVNGTVKYKGLKGSEQVYELSSSIGTKG